MKRTITHNVHKPGVHFSWGRPVNIKIMVVKLLTIFIFVAILGCQHENSNQESSQLIGRWITDSCDQNGPNPATSWGKAVYKFLDSGEANMSIRWHSDSSCVGEYRLTEVNEGQTYFSDYGQETLKEGILGSRVEIAFSANHAVEGFYNISNGSLCFSNNLKFNTFSWSSSETDNTNINFDRCLTKLNQSP